MNVCPQCKRMTNDSGICKICGASLITAEQWRSRQAPNGEVLKAQRLDDVETDRNETPEQDGEKKAAPMPKPSPSPAIKRKYMSPYPQALYTPLPITQPRPTRPKPPPPPYYGLKLLLGSILSVGLFIAAFALAALYL